MLKIATRALSVIIVHNYCVANNFETITHFEKSAFNL